MDLALEAIALKHIIKHIPSPRPSEGHTSPLFVGIQGPQGIGKTTLTAQLASTLSQEPYSFRVVTFSIDDLYLGHEALKDVGRANPKNGLLQGRGQPGTHDIPLGAETLKGLSQINLRDSA
ncbi:15375_t:CDS:1, partial [Acaulospora colombiana]